MTRTLSLLCSLLLLCCSLQTFAGTVYVTPSGAGAHDGTSWSNALDASQLRNAVNNSSNTDFWIAAGTYYPGVSGETGNSFVVNSGVGLYGGFNGTESNLSERNITANPTILSGDLDKSNSLTANDAFSVIYAAVIGWAPGYFNTIVVDGFTITGGNNTSSGYYNGGGLGLHTNSSGDLTYTIRNCIIRDNYASNSGGGIQVQGNCRLENCFFENNTSGYGSGVQISGYSLTAINCIFRNNNSGAYVAIDGYGNASITNCSFSGPVPYWGYVENIFSNVSIKNSILWYTQGSTAMVTGSIQGNFTIDNSDIQNGWSGAGTGNINTDPLFIDAALHTSSCSPIIDAGSNTGAPATDYAGNLRPFGGSTDMGAYEIQSSPAHVPVTIQGSTALCLGETTTLTASGSGNYVWKVDNAAGAHVLDGTTSAVLAVGLHKLKAGYTGPAVKIRRSSDGAMSDIGFSGDDLDVAAFNAFVAGSEGYCMTLYDQSGNGNNLVQNNTAQQPLLVISGSGGKPVLRFTPLRNLKLAKQFPAPYSVIYAAKQTGPTRQRMLQATGNNWFLGWWGGYKDVAYFNSWVASPTTFADNGTYIYSATGNGSSSSVYRNGDLLGSSNATAPPVGVGLNGGLAGNEGSDGDFMDVLVFNTVLTTTQRNLVEGTISSYYDIVPGGIVVGTGSQLTVTPGVTTTYTVTSTDPCGSSSATHAITIPELLVITGAQRFCTGSSATLDAGQHESYSWSSGETTRTINVSAAGTYTVTVTDNGCTQTKSISIAEATPLDSLLISATQASSCPGSKLVLNANAWAGGNKINKTTTYYISADKLVNLPYGCGATQYGSAVGYAPAWGFTWQDTSTATIISVKVEFAIGIENNYYGSSHGTKLNGADGAGFSSPYWQFCDITPNFNPVYAFEVNTQNYVQGGTNTFMITSPPYDYNSFGLRRWNDFDGNYARVTVTYESDISFAWTPGDLTGQAVSVYPTNNTTYTLNATYLGCTSTATYDAVLHPVPTITAESSTALCPGSSVTLTSSSGDTYLWSNGATTQSITVGAAGSYSVTVDNCTSAAPVAVTMKAIPTISASAFPTICPGQSITLSASTGSSYLWSTGETTKDIVVSEAGTYTVAVTDADGCTQSSAAQSVLVESIAKPVAVAGYVDACGGYQLYYLDRPYGYEFSLEWYKVGEPDPVQIGDYVGLEAGDYYVVATRNGCSSEHSDTVHVVFPSKGNPDEYGNNTWNVYTFQNYNYDEYNPYYVYLGYYTEPLLSFDTRDRWDANAAPYEADNYIGCTYDYDYLLIDAKRKGVPCGHYSIDIPAHDDWAELWIDSVKVWSHQSCCDAHTAVWEGDLNPNSLIEYKVTEISGGAYGSITFNLLQTTTHTYYKDEDGDGHGNNTETVTDCIAPDGYVLTGDDCDDTDAAIYPGATETLNGKDDNCDGNIDEGLCQTPVVLATSNITTRSARLNWTAVPGAQFYELKGRRVGSNKVVSKQVSGATTSFVVTGLQPSTTYTWRIRTICAAGNSAYSVFHDFTTKSLSVQSVEQPVEAIAAAKAKLDVYPNPAQHIFTVRLLLDASVNGNAEIKLVNALGKVVYATKSDVLNGRLQKEINSPAKLASGYYFIVVTIGKEVYTERLVIAR